MCLVARIWQSNVDKVEDERNTRGVGNHERMETLSTRPCLSSSFLPVFHLVAREGITTPTGAAYVSYPKLNSFDITPWVLGDRSYELLHNIRPTSPSTPSTSATSVMKANITGGMTLRTLFQKTYRVSTDDQNNPSDSDAHALDSAAAYK
ncbi:hypothetical protein PT974_08885 [Cladobotryum mycophilum]|uniref:Uncharacterized protein n=1 Tax=Cladobotryum mycophilum TaxID=491253 RepID=A0ABR0SFK4_9HYPO